MYVSKLGGDKGSHVVAETASICIVSILPFMVKNVTFNFTLKTGLHDSFILKLPL
jgi:hypothetical protein